MPQLTDFVIDVCVQPLHCLPLNFARLICSFMNW